MKKELAILDTANCGVGHYGALITLPEVRGYINEGLANLSPVAYSDVAQ